MSAIPKKKLTAAEYLAIENAAEFKSEFYDGVMYPLHGDGITAMAGANPHHNRIKENLIGELFGLFGDGPCQSYSSDQRVRLTDIGCTPTQISSWSAIHRSSSRKTRTRSPTRGL